MLFPAAPISKLLASHDCRNCCGPVCLSCFLWPQYWPNSPHRRTVVQKGARTGSARYTAPGSGMYASSSPIVFRDDK